MIHKVENKLICNNNHGNANNDKILGMDRNINCTANLEHCEYLLKLGEAFRVHTLNCLSMNSNSSRQVSSQNIPKEVYKKKKKKKKLTALSAKVIN